MDAQRRHDVFDRDIAPDDELPAYEPATAPCYEPAICSRVLYTYSLRCANRKLQQWVPYGPARIPLYNVKCYGAFRVFSSKPDMVLSEVSHETALEREIASVSFDRDGPLPWRPRARIVHPDSAAAVGLESKNFSDWEFTTAGVVFVWKIESKPTSLALREASKGSVVARFTYSKNGTLATNGAEVGKLELYRNEILCEGDVTKVMASVMVPITHFKGMGRQYWNPPQSEDTR
jgi:hypothetical protein